MQFPMEWILPSIVATSMLIGWRYLIKTNVFLAPPFVFEFALATGIGVFAGYFWQYSLGFIPIIIVVAIYCFYNAYKNSDTDAGIIFLIYGALTAWGLAVMALVASYFYLLL